MNEVPWPLHPFCIPFPEDIWIASCESYFRYLAMDGILIILFFCGQVKFYCINCDGADVIQHMIDNFVLWKVLYVII